MPKKKFDLEKLSLDELKQPQNDVAVAIAEYEKRKREEAKAALEEKAREMGYSAEKLFGPDKSDKKTSRTKKKAPPKYADPADPNRTSSGRGRKSDWVEAHLAEGKSLDDLKISPQGRGSARAVEPPFTPALVDMSRGAVRPGIGAGRRPRAATDPRRH